MCAQHAPEGSVIHIKNMVCQRCIQAVEQELQARDIAFQAVQLGKVSLPVPLNDKQKEELAQGLQKRGFTLLTDKNNRQIEAIKNLIIEVVHYGKEVPPVNFSDYLSQQLHQDYGHISRLFSSVEGITIEKYLILQKVERIKELLIYDELTPTEIAYAMNYSSLQHMSNQFKKVTGMSPRAFKSLMEPHRKPLDKIK